MGDTEIRWTVVAAHTQVSAIDAPGGAGHGLGWQKQKHTTLSIVK